MANINQSMQEVIQELKSKIINDQKGDLASVIGSPAVGTDSVPVLLSKLQTNKNNLATNLGSKGVTASGSESIEILVGKVGNIITGKKWASGQSTTVTNGILSVSSLPFKPSIIIVYSRDINQTYQTLVGIYWSGKVIYDGTSNYNSILVFNTSSISRDTTTVTNNGFSFPVYNNRTYDWIAFE